ncbi:MAG: type III-B CRISPR module-associated Cmr3 family protein [Anaerolineae bacterium]
MKVHLFLRPADVWLFRDGRSFDAGTDAHAHSIFPPFPTTVQGALRSHDLAIRGVSFTDYARGPDDCLEHKTREAGRALGWPGGGYGGLQVVGPHIALRAGGQNVKRFFARPADLYRTWTRARTRHEVLQPLRGGQFITNASDGLLPLWWHGGPHALAPEFPEPWIMEDSLRKYLENVCNDLQLEHDERFFVPEYRIGLAMEHSARSARKGYLYQVEYQRLKHDTGLSVVVEGLSAWPDAGTLRFGGDGHAALYHKVDLPTRLPSKITGPRFKIYFASPAFFKGGWRPVDWSLYFSAAVRLVAVALPRPKQVGGWDIVRRQPKAMERYVPAGSVFFFEASEACEYKNVPVTESGQEIGYGQIAISAKEWTYV